MFKEDVTQHEGQFERGICPRCGHHNMDYKEIHGKDEVWICEGYIIENGRKRQCCFSWRVERTNV